MASTVKTLQGEILVTEVEAVSIDNAPAIIAKNPMIPTRVSVTGRSGIKYDITNNYQGAQALKVYTALLDFVAGTGHATFDPLQVK